MSFFQNTIDEQEIFPKKKWFRKFEKYWTPSEEIALKELRGFVNNKLKVTQSHEIIQIQLELLNFHLL